MEYQWRTETEHGVVSYVYGKQIKGVKVREAKYWRNLRPVGALKPEVLVVNLEVE